MKYLYFDILPKELIGEISEYSSLFDLLEFRKISEWTRLGSERVFQEKFKKFKRIKRRIIEVIGQHNYILKLSHLNEDGLNTRLMIRPKNSRIPWVELRHNVITTPARYEQLDELLKMMGI